MPITRRAIFPTLQGFFDMGRSFTLCLLLSSRSVAPEQGEFVFNAVQAAKRIGLRGLSRSPEKSGVSSRPRAHQLDAEPMAVQTEPKVLLAFWPSVGDRAEQNHYNQGHMTALFDCRRAPSS